MEIGENLQNKEGDSEIRKRKAKRLVQFLIGQNNNYKLSEIEEFLKAAESGFYIENAPKGGHSKIRQQEQYQSKHDEKVSRARFFPMPAHTGKTVSPDIVKGLKLFMLENMTPEKRLALGCTRLPPKLMAKAV